MIKLRKIFPKIINKGHYSEYDKVLKLRKFFPKVIVKCVYFLRLILINNEELSEYMDNIIHLIFNIVHINGLTL